MPKISDMTAALSDAAKHLLATAYSTLSRAATEFPGPDDLAGWARLRAEVEARCADHTALLEHFAPTIGSSVIAGVPCLEITPRRVTDADARLVYVHGGGYTLYSAHSQLPGIVPIATLLGLRAISIDYTPAPAMRHAAILEQVVAVMEALVTSGVRPSRIALFGDSAGGALATAAVLALRARQSVLPAALLLWSPWSDITETGDSYETLRAHDPVLRYRMLRACAEAYAPPTRHRDALVSPVYAAYDADFPPTLIQVGTREIFLSNAVRLHRAMVDAHVRADLDVCEGMPHAFQISAYRQSLFDMPEAVAAVERSAAFVAHSLAARAASGGQNVT